MRGVPPIAKDAISGLVIGQHKLLAAPFADMKGAEISLYFDTTDSTSHTSFAALKNCWLSILTP